MAKPVKCHCCLGSGEEQNPYLLGQSLRRLRMDVGLRQEEVASYMGITKSYLSRLEQGSRRWSPELVEAYKTALL